MEEELHLFIIWENARYKEKEIIEDIKKNFEIINVYEVEWSKEYFSSNLSRFYGTNLPKGSGKEEHCGNGKFLLIILKDNAPNYEKRLTSKGDKILNVNLFDKKSEYREMTGGGHKIHATNTPEETDHDLTLLLGKNAKDYLKENTNTWDGNIKKISTNIIGYNGWNSVPEMFYALNNCLNYAILRNYESLPDEIYENDHNDVDIICTSIEDAAYVLNASPVFEEDYRVHYKTKAEGRDVFFDLRHIGDNYYDTSLEEKILKERIYNNKGFYTLNTINYFYTLLYHALIQKPEFKKDYKEKLIHMQIENVDMNTTIKEYALLLKEWLIKNNYSVVIPTDKSVIINRENLSYFKPYVYNETVELLQNELNEKNNKIKELEKNLQDKKLEIDFITNSRTWKIFSPIRKLKNNKK